MTDTQAAPAGDGSLLLEAQGVRKEFGGLVAVNDVDFTIPARRS